MATDQAASGVGGPERELLVEWIRTAKKGDIGSYQKIYDAFAPKVLDCWASRNRRLHRPLVYPTLVQWD